MQQDPDAFQVVPWSFDFYRIHQDFAIDAPYLEQMLEQSGPTQRDLRDALSVSRRIQEWLYLMADRMPGLGRLFAPAALHIRLKEMNRYFNDVDAAGTDVRNHVKAALLSAWQDNQKVMLVGHSFGSVIAYDVLWELAHVDGVENMLDCFVTMGSPMGLQYVRSELRGAVATGTRRFPTNIRRWINIAAVGEVTAHHPALEAMQKEMAASGWLEEARSLSDVVTFFRGPDGLNVHKCYGYMYNEDTAGVVADWWGS